MTALIEIEHLSVRYGRREALKDVSGHFQKGSLTAIAGPNGAGKSSLLKAMAGIVKPALGRVVMAEADRKLMAYLPQAASVQRDFPMTVGMAVCTGFWREVGLGGKISESMQNKARLALADVGLEGLEHRQVAELSGGQFQRMLFARLIVQDPQIFLLDEPFSAIDAETTGRLIKLLLAWHHEGRTIICVLHDLLLIRKYFPESFVLSGKCLGHGHTHSMLEHKLFSFDLDSAELCPGLDTEEHHHHDSVSDSCPSC